MNLLKIISILFMFFMSSFTFAKDFSVKLSQKHKLVLEKNNWTMASGAFYPGSTAMNIYSHNAKKEHQVFFEDIYIPRIALKDRLPANCLELINSKKAADFCKTESAVSNSNFSVSITSLFKVSKSNVVKVRTVYIHGKKNDVDLLVNKARGQRFPASKKGAL
jgi:hypothetical protein